MSTNNTASPLRNGAILVVLLAILFFTLDNQQVSIQNLTGYASGMESNISNNELGSSHLDSTPLNAAAEFKEAMEYLEDGDTAKAISKLESAYDIEPHPSVLFNLSRVHERQGNIGQAIQYLERYLNAGPEDSYLAEEHLQALNRQKSGN